MMSSHARRSNQIDMLYGIRPTVDGFGSGASTRAARPRAGGRTAPHYLPCALLSSNVLLSRSEDAFLGAGEADLRAQYSAEIAYLRGDCAPAKERFRAVKPADRTFLCACALAQSAAISTGDDVLYSEAALGLRRVAQGPDQEVALIAELALATATVSMFDASRSPFWLREGDLLCFPPEVRPWSIYLHVKYLQNLREFRPMLDVARTALALCARPEGHTPLDIYLRLVCAAACYGLDDREAMERWLDGALKAALPHGLIMPFAETVLAYGDVLDHKLRSDWPQYHRDILRKSKEVSRHWLAFHNRFTQDDAALVLTVQEYHLAQLISAGMSYTEAARYMQLSLGRVRNIVSDIYDKLHIKSRKELKRFIL